MSELLDIIPNDYERNYYVIKNGEHIRLTTKDVVMYILKGYTISDLCDIVYSEYTGKLVQAQSLYTMYSNIKNKLRKLYEEKGIMGEALCAC